MLFPTQREQHVHCGTDQASASRFRGLCLCHMAINHDSCFVQCSDHELSSHAWLHVEPLFCFVLLLYSPLSGLCARASAGLATPPLVIHVFFLTAVFFLLDMPLLSEGLPFFPADLAELAAGLVVVLPSELPSPAPVSALYGPLLPWLWLWLWL